MSSKSAFFILYRPVFSFSTKYNKIKLPLTLWIDWISISLCCSDTFLLINIQFQMSCQLKVRWLVDVHRVLDNITWHAYILRKSGQPLTHPRQRLYILDKMSSKLLIIRLRCKKIKRKVTAIDSFKDWLKERRETWQVIMNHLISILICRVKMHCLCTGFKTYLR